MLGFLFQKGANMKVVRLLIMITVPIFLIMLFASLLTTKQYLLISKDHYESHQYIDFDYDYAAEHIMGYLNYRYDDLLFGASPDSDEVIMIPIEISHMADVKNLYTILRFVAIISLILAVSLTFYLFKKDRKAGYDTYKKLYIAPVFFVMFVGGYMVIDFDTAFTVFHQIFFTNDDYNIPVNVLLRILPMNFWLVSGFIILVSFVSSLGLIHYLNERLYKKYLRNL